MKEGSLCRCITDFIGALSGEIILYKNDIVQVHKIIDKLWLEGEGGGCCGRFPQSCVIEIDIPTHPPNTVLYVAFADFSAQQEGDLSLLKNEFVIGINSVDQDWVYGECIGKKGVFPLNFVWKVDESISLVGEETEQPLNLFGKVQKSIVAQLPDEISLHAGDVVKITGVIDNYWYKGIYLDRKGIFPRTCVELVGEEVYKAFEAMHILETFPKAENPKNVSDCLLYNEKQAKPTLDQAKLDPNWKSFTCDNNDLFDDDYFKINMPSVSSTSSAAQNFSSFISFSQPSFRQHEPNVQNLIEYDQPSNLHTPLYSTNSLSAEIDNYLSANLNTENQCQSDVRVHEDLLGLDLIGTYTEDNTGINPYGRAAFSFTAQYLNELSFKKGEIVHLICHIDSHWTLGKLGVSKGIFPTSYIDIIVDCPYKDIDLFEKRLDAVVPLKKAIVCFDYLASEPGDISASEGDLVIIKKFVSENWAEIETIDGESGIFPLNYLNVLVDDADSHKETNSNLNTASCPKRNFDKSDFSTKSQTNFENALTKNIESLNVNLPHTKPRDRFNELVMSFRENTLSQETKDNIDKDINVKKCVQKLDKKIPPPIPPRNIDIAPTKPIEEVVRPDSSNFSHLEEPHYKSPNSSQIHSLSIYIAETPQKGPLKEEHIYCEVSEHSPRRPAPPRPSSDLESDAEADAHEESTSIQDLKEPNQSPTSSIKDEKSCEGASSFPSTSSREKRLYLRREAISELVTTEHEYVHDLESLVQVVRVGKSRKDAKSVDLPALMGNLQQVIEVSKKFVKKLGGVSFNEDEDVMVGAVFASMADEICSVYKVYSSNNSVFVGPLLDQYQEFGESAAFLQWVLTELRQHKVNLLDMRAVLIKPVQRVLKYPLFIDNLVHNTPPTHPDYKNLQEARVKMLNVAKEVNEYTKRIDLVNKYRRTSQHSLGEKIQRISMHSMAKKSSRLRTKISATMGFINATKDLKFEVEEAKFRALGKATRAISDLGLKMIESAKGRHGAELGVVEATSAALREAARIDQVEELRNLCRDVCSRIVENFETTVQKRVLGPTRSLGRLCAAPEHLIQKRKDKLLDFDTVQRKFDRNKDQTKTRLLEEEMSRARGVYEALNKQLVMDLPVINGHGMEVLCLALKSLEAARMALEGRVADLYVKLAQAPAFAHLKTTEFQKTFSGELADSRGRLKELSFAPADAMARSPRFERRRSALMSLVKKETTKKRRSAEKSSGPESTGLSGYDPARLFRACSDHAAEDPFEVDLAKGSLVAVIKNKDPSGTSSRWFVDTGTQKGFVKSECLIPCEPQNIPSSSASSSTENQPNPRPGPAPSTPRQPSSNSGPRSVRIKPRAPEPTRNPPNTGVRPVDNHPPPRYEELFPDQLSAAGVIAPASKHRKEQAEEDAGGHRYEYIEETGSEEDATDGLEPASKNVYFQEPDAQQPKFYYSLYPFAPGDSNQLSLYEGQVVLPLITSGDWWFVEDRGGNRGYVPAAYLAEYSSS